jgi:hypothetical protein
VSLTATTRRKLRSVPIAPVPPAPRLDALPCRVCAGLPAVIVALRAGIDLHDEMLAWCSCEHARSEGWPFLKGECASPSVRAAALQARAT